MSPRCVPRAGLRPGAPATGGGGRCAALTLAAARASHGACMVSDARVRAPPASTPHSQAALGASGATSVPPRAPVAAHTGGPKAGRPPRWGGAERGPTDQRPKTESGGNRSEKQFGWQRGGAPSDRRGKLPAEKNHIPEPSWSENIGCADTLWCGGIQRAGDIRSRHRGGGK